MEVASPDTYPHYSELKAGSEATKRIIETIRKAQRHAQSAKALKTLMSRVDDWKGHRVENFGSLLMSDILMVTKDGIDRKYTVVLFERAVLFLEKSIPDFNTTTPLVLKGSISIGNIIQAVPVSTRSIC